MRERAATGPAGETILPGAALRWHRRHGASPGAAGPLDSSAALRLAGLARSHRTGLLRPRRRVFADVGLRLEPGERRGLVGPNGAGKSTLLRLAAGTERPDAGTVEHFGVDVGRPRSRRATGWVPDGSPFPAELTPREALELGADLAGLRGRERRERCARMLARVGLGEVRTRVGKLSLGMARRLALANGFVHEPRLVLLDEPTTGLDAEGLGVLEELLDEARARGAALFVSSHRLDELERWTDGLVLLQGGRLRAVAAEEVRATDGAPSARRLLRLFDHAEHPGDA